MGTGQLESNQGGAKVLLSPANTSAMLLYIITNVILFSFLLSPIFWRFAVVRSPIKRGQDPMAAALSQQSHSFHRVVMLSL